MTPDLQFEKPCWYVVQTHPKHETRAESNLGAWGVETFCPMFRDRRFGLYDTRPTYTVKPLFPRYIFARFKINDLYHKVRFTRGVHSLVSFNDYPTPIAEDIIDIIKARVKKDGFVHLGEDFKEGDEVRIKEGPFKDFTGVFEQNLKESDRVRILLQAVSYQTHIVIDRLALGKLDKTA